MIPVFHYTWDKKATNKHAQTLLGLKIKINKLLTKILAN